MTGPRNTFRISLALCLLGLLPGSPAAADDATFTLPSPLVERAAFSCGDINLTGGAVVDSWGVNTGDAYGADEISEDDSNTSAILHGRFASLRLKGYTPPGSAQERVRFAYKASGKLGNVSFPHESGNRTVWDVDCGDDASAATNLRVTAPWGHEIDYTIADEGAGWTLTTTESLEVAGVEGAPDVSTTYSYLDDGRLHEINLPDGSKRVTEYYPTTNRLAKANILDIKVVSTTQESRGTAEYAESSKKLGYGADNLPTSFTDGESRSIGLPTPFASEQATFQAPGAAGVSATFDYDQYGRLEASLRGGEDGISSSITYQDDPDLPGAGRVQTYTRGDLSETFSYDGRGNVKRRENTVLGVFSTSEYDLWDRAIHSVEGLTSAEALANVGASGEPGAITERAFDAAGHLVRERWVQDIVTAEGTITNREITRRFEYNDREQLISIEQNGVATPGDLAANADATVVTHFSYDAHGRLHREYTPVVVAPPGETGPPPAVDTTYRYDLAGRVAGVRVGETAEQSTGYDINGRVIYRHDGDESEWQGRYDAWDRLWWEKLPTKAEIVRTYDKADNLTKEQTFDEDGSLMAEMRTEISSLGLVQYIREALTSNDDGEPAEWRVTRKDYDTSGRVTAVYSGSGDATGNIDAATIRRDVKYDYEAQTGRVLRQWFGDENSPDPYYFVEYSFDTGSQWPSETAMFESVPGQSNAIETSRLTVLLRDAFGRSLLEQSSTGALTKTIYDRGGPPISVTTDAQSTASFSYDSQGLLLKAVRAMGRGETSYAYDLDGRLLRQSVQAENGVWETAFRYEAATGRLSDVVHPGGTDEHFTYNPDGSVDTKTDRDGIVFQYSYDAANQLLAVSPELPDGATPEGLAELDGGDRYTYDDLGRLQTANRHDASAQADARLAVTVSGYDLAARPISETVGSRESLQWGFDAWDRPETLTLPSGIGRSANDPFTAYRREYTELDQLKSVTTIGGRPSLGATWHWGGAHLFGQTNNDPLHIATRFSYFGLAGQGGDAASKGKLESMTFGFAGNAESTAALESPWGRFAYGWRTAQEDQIPNDGFKIGREVTDYGTNLLGGMGWSWGMTDGGARLSHAYAGKGSVQEMTQPPPDTFETFNFFYGDGDELERMSPGHEPEVNFTVGDTGRIDSRRLGWSGVENQFRYSGAGRRIEDDRYLFEWNWRGELVSVTVKDEWPSSDPDVAGSGPVTSQYAGHQVRYEWDATGRLLWRLHLGPIPESGTNDDRGFIERRDFLWDGDTLLTEAGYGQSNTSIHWSELTTADLMIRWRKSYVPGASGLDDAVQVRVEVFAPPDPNQPGVIPYPDSLYSYLRDELGSVIAIVEVDEDADPNDGFPDPSIVARYWYTPFGEAYVHQGVGEPDDIDFDGVTTAGNHLGYRFPGGQSSLFQGLWHDPVTGLAFARARWLDSRNASWLSEDPARDLDSPNLYAFVAWQPHMATDPMGEVALVDNAIGGLISVGIGFGLSCLVGECSDYTRTDAGIDFGLGFATSGLSNISKLRHLSRLEQFAIRGGLETTLDFGAEVARHELKGENYDLGDLAIGSVINLGIGEGGSFMGRRVGQILPGPDGRRLARLKGNIGEKLTEWEYRLRGYDVVGRQVTMQEIVYGANGNMIPNQGARARWDHVMRHRRTDSFKVVETKFGPYADLMRGQPAVADSIRETGEALVRGRSSIRQMRDAGFSGGSYRRGMPVDNLEFGVQRFRHLEALFTMFLF